MDGYPASSARDKYSIRILKIELVNLVLRNEKSNFAHLVRETWRLPLCWIISETNLNVERFNSMLREYIICLNYDDEKVRNKYKMIVHAWLSSLFTKSTSLDVRL